LAVVASFYHMVNISLQLVVKWPHSMQQFSRQRYASEIAEAANLSTLAHFR
jgi:hypothetical protein